MLLLKPTSVCSTQKSFTHHSKVILLISLFAFIPLICNLSLPSALHFVARIGEFFVLVLSRYVISTVSPSRVDPLVWNYYLITLCCLSF